MDVDCTEENSHVLFNIGCYPALAWTLPELLLAELLLFLLLSPGLPLLGAL